MSLRKYLIKLNNKLETSWNRIDFTQSGIQIKGGWYVTEFVVTGAIDHTPRILVTSDDAVEQERLLIGFHAGRNRMLIFLPDGRLSAFSKSIEFETLSRVSYLEGRARVLLICGRYLADFFSLRVLLKMILMQFHAQDELSTDLLHFYSPAPDRSYLSNVQGWERFKKFDNFLTWWHRDIRIAVVIERPEQRELLNGLLVKPDTILHRDQTIPLNIDFVLPLKATEQLRRPAILMLKRALKKVQKKAKKNQAQALTLVYTDHDCPVKDVGVPVFDPVLKPQPSQAYLYCFNYIGPAVLFSRAVVSEFAPADLLSDELRYRLALTCFAQIERVHHVSEALLTSDRTESIITPQPHSDQSAWPDILWQRRDGYNSLLANVKGMATPSVDLVIPTRDGLAVLKPCVDSLLKQTAYPNFKIIVVDNGSELAETHDYFTQIQDDDRVTVVSYPGEFNYSAINNFAVAQGRSEYVALVNNDIEVIHSDWLHQMMVWAVQDNVGVVGAKLLFSNGLIQHAGVTIGMGNAAGHIHRLEPGDSPGYQYRCLATQNMMAVTAACLVTPRALFEQLDGLDADSLSVAYNDIDYCLRVEAMGKEIIWTPEARLFHHESVSRGDDMSEQHIQRYFNELSVLQKRWKTKGFVDKYYSPHLRISDEGVYPQLPSTKQDELIVL